MLPAATVIVRCRREHMFVPAGRPDYQYRQVMRLLDDGLSDYEVGRRTGIPRSTVLNWRRRTSPPVNRRLFMSPVALRAWRPADLRAYAYLLGLYLGDGCIVEVRRCTPRLVLVLDARYGRILDEADAAIRRVVTGIDVRRNTRDGCIALVVTHPVWPSAFPQHGPGRKHTRSIKLVGWQLEITRQHPKPLVRGLIHSDGSRCTNRFKTRLPSGRVAEYAYTRYFFTNYSADIRGIFCEHCDLLGIRWTQSSFKNISISHRDSVALLDSFVGPKA